MLEGDDDGREPADAVADAEGDAPWAGPPAGVALQPDAATTAMTHSSLARQALSSAPFPDRRIAAARASRGPWVDARAPRRPLRRRRRRLQRRAALRAHRPQHGHLAGHCHRGPGRPARPTSAWSPSRSPRSTPRTRPPTRRRCQGSSREWRESSAAAGSGRPPARRGRDHWPGRLRLGPQVPAGRRPAGQFRPAGRRPRLSRPTCARAPRGPQSLPRRARGAVACPRPAPRASENQSMSDSSTTSGGRPLSTLIE